MAANTDVAVCNLAIDAVRGERITNLQTGTSEEAKVCRLHYDHLKHRLLRGYDWWFATRYAQIAKSAIIPIANEWNFQYPLPADFAALRELVDTGASYMLGSDAIDGRVIFTNDTTLKIRYTAIVDEGQFTESFTGALAATLAVELGRALKGTTAKARDLAAERELRLGDAMEDDANENTETLKQLYVNMR